jgi:hypothetical protein
MRIPPPVGDEISPITGLHREDWAALADRLLLALRPWASPDHARIALPGRASRYGGGSDELEGFARSFLLAAMRLRGDGGTDPHDLAGWYAGGLLAGTDPASPTRWPRPDVLDQAKVEAASIALGLHLTRPWIWDALDDAGREHVVTWLAGVVGQDYPPINWVWFQIVVESFLRSVGGPWSADDIARGLAVHESLYRGGGWYSDGPERAYDHYVGWALHLYPLLWAEFAGDSCPATLEATWRTRLADYLDDAVHLVGADGSPLAQGRSLIYRFATAAPFWVGAMSGATRLPAGLTRRACSGMLRSFTSSGVPDPRGLLTLGWHGQWPAMAQAYSGPGSPYWAVKGMLGLVLPADHPVWTAVEEPLPVEGRDGVRAVGAPGWLISATRRDGVVRVLNHGTDHCAPRDARADSPLYARLGYSTATLPPLVGEAVAHPADNSVVLLHPSWGASHRAGFERIRCEVVAGTGVAVSAGRAHWVRVEQDSSPDHGSGRGGAVRWGPWVTVGSMIRGGVEVRAARLDAVADPHPVPEDAPWRLELSGWPLASSRPPDATVRSTGCAVLAGGLVSRVGDLGGFGEALVRRQRGTSPLGEHVAVPLVRTAREPVPGRVYLAVVTLAGSTPADPAGPLVDVSHAPGGHEVLVTWPDGATSVTLLPAPPAGQAAHHRPGGPTSS